MYRTHFTRISLIFFYIVESKKKYKPDPKVKEELLKMGKRMVRGTGEKGSPGGVAGRVSLIMV